jgi:predicted NAD/FAD-binding protein
MLRMPVAAMARFCRDHGILRALRRPRGRSILGGADVYVRRMLASIADARLATPVRRVRRLPIGGADVSTDRGSERFDAVVFACHSVDALALLADPSAEEREVLGAFHYQRNRAILHTDVGVLPLREAAWAAWNYEAGRGPADETSAACVHVLVNRLQRLPFELPVIVSLNPIQEPAAASVQGEFHYAHPIFDRRALAAQERLPALQGRADSWFCGAWTGLGSHEDGLASAFAVCAGLAPRL